MEKKLRELISKFLQEYSGHHTMKNASPRPFADDKDEIESYTYKSIYGGDGGHYKNEPAFHNPNRTKMGMFELKKFIEDTIKEQAYNHATLTTQGLPNSSRAIVPTDEYPFSARPKSRLPGIMEEDEPIDPDYQGPSYDEAYLSKLVDSGMSSIFYKERNLFYIYPNMRDASNIPNPRLTTTYQSIVFKLERGELHFVQAMIYERMYDELKSVFPELPQGHGGASGFTNINGGSEITYPILLPNGGNDIEKAKQMIQVVKKGLTQQANAESGFNDPERTGGFKDLGIGRGRMNERSAEDIARTTLGAQKVIANDLVDTAENAVDDTQASNAAGTAASTQAIDAARIQLVNLEDQLSDARTKHGQEKQRYQQEKERYEEIPTDETNLEEKTAMYEELQKLKETIKTLFTQMGTLSTSVKAARNAESQAVSASYKGKAPLSPLEKAVRDARKAARNVGKTQTAESLLRQYEKERANINLMEQMDSYNETTRGSLQKFFEMFEAGRTTSEVIRHYAKKGIQIPEQFVSKVKKQFESYKKLKLELGFSEQEAKDFKKALDLSQKEDKKELSTRIFKK
jgi:hypothetical protein